MTEHMSLEADDFSGRVGYQSHSRSLGLYYLFAVTLAISLIIISENIYFKDYGDFSRAIGFMLMRVRDEPHQLWPFRADGIGHIRGIDISAGLFKLLGTVQYWGGAIGARLPVPGASDANHPLVYPCATCKTGTAALIFGLVFSTTSACSRN